MSNRNNQANKQAARERLRAERERQAKRDKVRRQLTVGGAIVAVLAVAGGIGVVVANSGGSDGTDTDTAAVAKAGGGADSANWVKAAKAKLVKPAHTSGENGTTIVVGKADAKNTLELFEDARCPGCASFEQNVGGTVQKDIKDGKYKVSFHLGTFLDANLKGTGSKNALSAMGAALNVSTDAFLKFKEALYSKEYHPDEMGPDKFADDSYLLKIADTVDGLKGNQAFQKAVKSGTYDKWALVMSQDFNTHKEVQSTPTVKMNGTIVGTDSDRGKAAPSTPDAFTSMIGEQMKS
ncbi:thioredoxin domain-containing protein [Streptomyces sp. MST-110588]|uniref:thioredoxin domain-containing protein n=1 Tax=Streptomyces sp. MST-110588 TaxID=2833628 RepID=UPI001F5C855A|nr:thioredoxin domain-containing protein [Streptomyces sp. MST-110588]UNO42601.1 DsbA family protein [Streptomyces sp. MST-110588]